MERARLREQALCASGADATDPTVRCQAADARVVEFVEVRTHQGAEQTQAVSARRQYINLDERAAESQLHFDYGREIRLKARVEWARGDTSRSLEDVPVYLYVTPDPNNRTGLTGGDRAGFTQQNSGTLRLPVRAQADGWTPEVSFFTSRYAGDRFRVGATTDARYEGGTQTGWLEVWRRIWYEIAQMARPGGGHFQLPSGALDQIKAAYRAVKFEMVDAGALSRSTDHVQNFDDHEHAYAWADRFVGAVHTPWKLHFVVIDHLQPIARRAEREFIMQCHQIVATTESFRPYTFGGREWLIAAQYQHGTDWVDFARDKVTLASSSTWTQARIDFSGAEETPSAQNVVPVKLGVYEATTYGGWGGTNLHMMICLGALESLRGDDPATIAAEVAATCIHECGHGLGLVYGSLPWRTTVQSQGNHCGLQSCVMWFSTSPSSSQVFHVPSGSTGSGCHTFLRGKNMERETFTTWRYPRTSTT